MRTAASSSSSSRVSPLPARGCCRGSGWISGCRSARWPRTSKAAGSIRRTRAGRNRRCCLMSSGRVRGSPSAGRSRACSGRTTIPATVPISTPSTCPASCSRSSAWPTRWRATGRTSRRDRARLAATAPRNRQPSECLFVADTGDNNQVRPDVTIYIVVEPQVGGAGAASPTAAARSLRLSLPERAHRRRGARRAARTAISPSSPRDAGARSTSSRFLRTTVARAIASGEIVTARYVAATPAFGPNSGPADW